jgi:hypothetical protein
MPEPEAFGPAGDDFAELLQAATNMPMVTAAQIPVQRRDPRAEARIMDAEWTPVPRAAPVANPHAASYAARLAELELMLEILARSRAIPAEADTRPRGFVGDPVALTQALHPGGLRSARRSARRVPPRDDSPRPVRVVVFDGDPQR